LPPRAAPSRPARSSKSCSRRKDAAEHAGSERAIAKQHEKGKLTARERIDLLLDEGSFVETDRLAVHRATGFGLEETKPLGDGVVTGYGTVDGRRVCVFSQDFTVFGGSLGEVFAEKIHKVMDLAIRMGVPMIGINDSGGARIQEGVVSLGGYGDIFYRNVKASGVIPQISAVMGPCAGGAVYSPVMTDFIFMVKETSHMFITGPEVIKTVTGEDVTFEELGGAMAHNVQVRCGALRLRGRGGVHRGHQVPAVVLPGEQPRGAAARRADRRSGAHRPRPRHVHAGQLERPLRHAGGHHPRRGRRGVLRGAAALGAEPRHRVRPPRRAPDRHRREPADASRGRARHRERREGRAVRPHLRRVQHPDRHLRRRPRVPARAPPRSGAGSSADGAKLLYAYCEATVPKLTVITRKAYGGAYDVMGSKHVGADVNLAWPTAEIAVMGAQGAVNILYRNPRRGR
jgi:propionyl-CoA carboxylase beta chain